MSEIDRRPPWRRSALWLDLFERAWIVALFVLLARRLFGPAGGLELTNILLVLSEGLVVLFVLVRRPPEAVSQRPAEWALAFAASSGPLLVAPGGDALAPAALGGLLLLVGTLVQLSAKLTLRRSFGVVPANRGVKVGGPYRIVRHPMYAGYLVTHVAFLLMNPSAWNAAVYLASFGLQLLRMLAEERLLGQDPRYHAFQQGVRYRLVPGVF